MVCADLGLRSFSVVPEGLGFGNELPELVAEARAQDRIDALEAQKRGNAVGMSAPKTVAPIGIAFHASLIPQKCIGDVFENGTHSRLALIARTGAGDEIERQHRGAEPVDLLGVDALDLLTADVRHFFACLAAAQEILPVVRADAVGRRADEPLQRVGQEQLHFVRCQLHCGSSDKGVCFVNFSDSDLF